MFLDIIGDAKTLSFDEFKNNFCKYFDIIDLNNRQLLGMVKIVKNIFSDDLFKNGIENTNVEYTIIPIITRIIRQYEFDKELEDDNLINDMCDIIKSYTQMFVEKSFYFGEMLYLKRIEYQKRGVNIDIEAEFSSMLADAISMEILDKHFKLKFFYYISFRNNDDNDKLLKIIFNEGNYILPIEKFLHSVSVVRRALKQLNITEITNYKIHKIYKVLNDNIELLHDNYSSMTYKFSSLDDESDLVNKLVELIK